MISRDDIGSWMSGPRSGRQSDEYPGKRLGRPRSGPGSVPGFGRRVLALLIDWAMCSLIAAWLLPENPFGPLIVFALENMLLISLSGGTAGHRLLGMSVVAIDGGWANPLRVVVRSVLLCLVVPAVVWNADNRGGHELAAGTLLVRTR